MNLNIIYFENEKDNLLLQRDMSQENIDKIRERVESRWVQLGEIYQQDSLILESSVTYRSVYNLRGTLSLLEDREVCNTEGVQDYFSVQYPFLNQEGFNFAKMREEEFRVRRDNEEIEKCFSFFKECKKYSTVDRSDLDSYAYFTLHGDFYGRAIVAEIQKKGKKFEKIFDLGGQGGAFYSSHFRKVVPCIDDYAVVDRYDYVEQKKILSQNNCLPTVYNMDWNCFFDENKFLDVKDGRIVPILFVFSFSINELPCFAEQVFLLRRIKEEYPGSDILCLDKDSIVENLGKKFTGDIADVYLRSDRAFHSFSSGWKLRQSLFCKRMWL